MKDGGKKLPYWAILSSLFWWAWIHNNAKLAMSYAIKISHLSKSEIEFCVMHFGQSTSILWESFSMGNSKLKKKMEETERKWREDNNLESDINGGLGV
tara:strand:- start:5279 stop:5572 length:294 start_codon:yes stop_codon:yes gene_type:complete